MQLLIQMFDYSISQTFVISLTIFAGYFRRKTKNWKRKYRGIIGTIAITRSINCSKSPMEAPEQFVLNNLYNLWLHKIWLVTYLNEESVVYNNTFHCEEICWFFSTPVSFTPNLMQMSFKPTDVSSLFIWLELLSLL